MSDHAEGSLGFIILCGALFVLTNVEVVMVSRVGWYPVTALLIAVGGVLSMLGGREYRRRQFRKLCERIIGGGP